MVDTHFAKMQHYPDERQQQQQQQSDHGQLLEQSQQRNPAVGAFDSVDGLFMLQRAGLAERTRS
jgi:hypothetical protein